MSQSSDPRNDLEGAQDQGGKQGDQAGQAKPVPRPGSGNARASVPPADEAKRQSATTKA